MTLKIIVNQQKYIIKYNIYLLINFIVSRNIFEFCYVIGKGGFGKVWKVRHKKSKQFYALKEMSKLKVLDKKSEKSINSERELLSKLHNPFIVNMHYAFQDAENLYLVMDLMPGGDLRFHISRHKKFSEEQTRFFICGIIIALEYIHSNNVIHRDIKPENLVLDENGYVRLTDFGIAKENMPDNKSETSGTPGYMSPEVMKALNHSFPVDFFALGVIGYEFMKGERPYVGKNRKEIKEQILAKQVELKAEDISEGWSKESADCINKLLIRKPENRIGYNGINELKMHPWLKYYPWEMLYLKTLPSPFIPENKDNFDRRYCESSDVITEETKLRYEEILMDDIYRTAFKKFYYNTDEDNKRKNDNDNNNRVKNKVNEKNNEFSHKKRINQSQKTITDINNQNNMENSNSNEKRKKSRSKNNNFKNSMKIIPTATKNLIIKNHKKSGSVVNYNKNLNTNNVNTNVGGNVSNNVIYINFNINHPNIEGNIYNNHQASPKTDRAIKQYKNSAKNIYCQGNTINNLNNINNNNNNSLIQKIGINIGSFVSSGNSVKKNKKDKNGNENKNIICNSKKKYFKNKNNKEIISNNNINENSKIYMVKNSKNTHNSMKDIYEQKNKTTILDLKDSKNLKKSEILTKRENSTSLDKSSNEIKIRKKDISHSNIFKQILSNEEKKENSNSLQKEKSNSNINNNSNSSQINKFNNNMNYYSKKVLLKYHSPKDEKKIKVANNPSSVQNIMKIKLSKNSRAYINNNNSNNNDISLNKSKTFLNDKQQQLKEIKEIKEIFKSNILKNKEGIHSSKNKAKNNYVNVSKKNFFSNEKANKEYAIKCDLNRNSDINLTNLKNKNSSFDNLDEKDILIKTVNHNKFPSKNNIMINNTINSLNKKMEQKKIGHIDSTKLIYQKNKNNYITNNKMNFFSPDETKLKVKNNTKIKQYKFPTNNLSVSSNAIKSNKNKDTLNSTANINNLKNKEDEKNKGFISARNNENIYDFRKSTGVGVRPYEKNNKNLIFSYRQKQKNKINK